MSEVMVASSWSLELDAYCQLHAPHDDSLLALEMVTLCRKVTSQFWSRLSQKPVGQDYLQDKANSQACKSYAFSSFVFEVAKLHLKTAMEAFMKLATVLLMNLCFLFFDRCDPIGAYSSYMQSGLELPT